MATGDPVEGVDLRVGDVVCRTGAGGLAELPPEGSGGVELNADGPWRLARRPGGPSEPADVEPLWAFRTMEVRGVVTGESSLVRLDSGRIRLVAFSAQPLPSAEPSFERDLTKASIAIRGTVRDPSGAPIAGALIRGQVIVEMPLSELDVGAIRASGHGYSLLTNRRTGRAVVGYDVGTVTSVDGSFELRSNVKGALFLMARPQGDFHPAFVEERSLEDDIEGLEVVASPGDGRFVRVLKSGTPFRGDLVFADLSRREQPCLTFRLGPAEAFPMSMLEPGHEYSVCISGRANLAYRGYLVWDERTTLELTALRKERWPDRK